MKTIAAAALAASLSLAAAARADEDVNRSDVRCVLGMTFLMRSPQYKEAGGAGSLYFAGRIDGRDPQFDLQAALKHEIARMSPMDYEVEARRCGQLLKTKNDALKEIGQALKAPR